MKDIYQDKKEELFSLLNPKHTALVIIDPQKGYMHTDIGVGKLYGCSMNLASKIIPPLNDFVPFVRKFNIPIVWTRMREDPDAIPSNFSTKMKLEGTNALTTPKDGSFDFVDEVCPEDTDKIVDKIRYDAFTDTDLHSHLQSKSVTTIILVGGYTSRCVHATAVLATSLGYHLFVPRDLVFVPDSIQDEQEQALHSMDTILGYVVDSTFITKALDSYRK